MNICDKIYSHFTFQGHPSILMDLVVIQFQFVNFWSFEKFIVQSAKSLKFQAT
jgi:hypothetical protein